MLAGDHLKAASDLGLPLVGVGLMYREGYFRQYLNVDGWQQERYPENDFFNLPLIPETKPRRLAAAGQRSLSRPRGLVPHLAHPGRPRAALPARHQHSHRTTPDDRQITGRLYGGDHDMRIRQEMILGIGGIRALRALGKAPTVCHMNEGHSAFCGLERIRVLMEENEPRLSPRPARPSPPAPASPRTRRCRPATTCFAPQLDRALLLRLPAAAEDRPQRVPRPGPAEPPRPERSRSA